MILIKLAKNKNKTIKEAYGKYYARPVVTETIGIDELAEHMSSHNTPFSKGAIKGLLTDMVSCVKELVLQNKAVKIDNLAIFSIGMCAVVVARARLSFIVIRAFAFSSLKAT